MGNFEHKPSLIIVLLFLLFLSLLLMLGTWQVQRAAHKTTILAAASKANSAAPVSPNDIGDVVQAGIDYMRVEFTGNYHGQTQFLWDNRVHKGQAGFEVITPVRTDSGIVLVNRGWVAPGRTRQDLPDVALSPELLNTPVTITGMFSRPSKGFASGDAFDLQAPTPYVMQYFDYQLIEQLLGEKVLAGVIQPQQKSGAMDSVAAGSSVVKRAEYYTANWEPIASIKPVRHYGYAFQWYAMAAALTILYIVYNTRRIEQA